MYHHPAFFHSESTGFQFNTNTNLRMNFNDNIKAQMVAWPKKLTSVMEIHRQRFSQLNNKFKQKSVVEPPQLPSQPWRSQVRSKQQIPAPRRSHTAQVQKQQPSPFVPNNQDYITLANLSNILCVLQAKANDTNDTASNASAATSTSAKQRVQQHLQETATRWWRPVRSSDSQATSSTNHASETSTGLQQHIDENIQLQKNLPLLTIASHSTRQIGLPSKKSYGTSKYDLSETSPELSTTNVFSSSASPARILNLQRTRQEPLIMQARGMHIHPYDHRYYDHHRHMNFFQQQRLIRQT